ncbi:hypothetical protein ONS95_012465 [Cadophora gregata]|uniref:uncharacterized protein n=1 Tax=Cadophora gregata TaxID=51156 RepID=UPI0026DA8F21|nr:uncharacterized protein ONS95_012465 [Cadophora gregata]KAK0118159.1 hypothetical protein ONS95_012465 [Cadophora gregata]KAK0123232.1 hypothetical protein ONS96_010231 [Cadophora gregata f. sp. sojae]
MTPTPDQPLSKAALIPGTHPNIDAYKETIGRGIAVPLEAIFDRNEERLYGVPELPLSATDLHDVCSFGPVLGCSNEDLLAEMNTQNALLDKALQKNM